MDGFGHTAGAIAGFTPNMGPEQVAELDRRRGLGDQGSFNEPDILINKKPWLNLDGTHKANDEEATMSKTAEITKALKAMRIPDEGEKFGKPVPQRSENEPKKDYFSRLIAHNMKRPEAKDNPKQAIAIAAHEAGVAKKADDSPVNHTLENLKKLKKFVTSAPPMPGSTPPAGAKFNAPSTGGSASTGPSMGSKTPTSTSPGVAKLRTPRPETRVQLSAKAQDNEDDHEDLADKLFGKDCGGKGKAVMPSMAPSMPAPMAAKPPMPSMATSTMKALNSKSLYIPPPLQPYDPFGVMSRGTAVPVSRADVTEGNQLVSRPEIAMKSCLAHGLTYRADKGCAPCNVQKSLSCKNCGGSLVKSFGGALVCPRGH